MVEQTYGMSERNSLTAEVMSYLQYPESIQDAMHGRMCGDGRYTETRGMMSRFGADGGYVLGLLSLNRRHHFGMQPEEIVDIVVAASVKVGGKFYAHTDTHATEPDAIGCGHLARAALPENSGKYGVVPEDVRRAIVRIKELGEEAPEHVEIAVLEGAHMEKGVLLNVGKRKKIKHRKGDVQWFVVAAQRDKDYVTNILFPTLQEALPLLAEREITADDFNAILGHQTDVTAGILAKGLPIIEVNADHLQPQIKLLGIVN